MFGQDDNQQAGQDNNSILQASMPGPLADDQNQPISSAASPTFGAPPVDDAAPAPDSHSPATSPTVVSTSMDSSLPSSPQATPANEELLDLKQQALQHLSPLVSHLDQTPEEKFRTTMMMIQASDDQTLVKAAFEAAQAISDDKARAQALLDIINEINYFTQHQTNQ